MLKGNVVRSLLMLSLFSAMAVGLTAGLTGCAPRGETDTLAGVLATSKKEFSHAADTVSDAALKEQMKSIAQNLESMIEKDANEGAIAHGSEVVATDFTTLINKAGYTSRASMNEIAQQHRILSQDAAKGAVNPARVKLLVARTYSLLASELETTKFAL